MHRKAKTRASPTASGGLLTLAYDARDELTNENQRSFRRGGHVCVLRAITIIDGTPFTIIDGLSLIVRFPRVPVASSLFGFATTRWRRTPAQRAFTTAESRALHDQACGRDRWQPDVAAA